MEVMTTDENTPTALTWDELPAPIATYLGARPKDDTATALGAFTEDASVTDEGHTYRGRDEILAWMQRVSTEYSYTTEFTEATRRDESHIDVTQHLEGDFPGGVVDLRFRFTLDGTYISRLTIEP
ncbi:nuclear transport factor 2 family protein [Mycolicibacterium smegmatis]|uniref:SnoaL-like domain-containing protein n=2 Tax=Mycolicibacterium smegmatis (strain ATCC 700084 / mc(2)155) TaxID=246196 RepID=A0QXU4_MYCS2|nr:conserved hypothetical protein [Mycolicibacterium smegmatis MC2 155]TBM41565.1 nuclear transport factor 2 family protein [Mycolicibacterium smegmatis]TBH29465.1 nuclear transport factor 2 family protein [Mycolicibacterium smegmatis MC2 155]TBM46203.1 nuclear transport factor 2 family protein [Mycolicibacterium smegmatis]TBM55932.1 nuclear transport factor 2 family protein [Mycolicibacterium smegmatis]